MEIVQAKTERLRVVSGVPQSKLVSYINTLYQSDTADSTGTKASQKIFKQGYKV